MDNVVVFVGDALEFLESFDIEIGGINDYFQIIGKRIAYLTVLGRCQLDYVGYL
jgi:hypothetical protein